LSKCSGRPKTLSGEQKIHHNAHKEPTTGLYPQSQDSSTHSGADGRPYV